MITIAIILVLITIFVKLTHDLKVWNKQKNINHSKEWLFMVISCGGSIILFALQLEFVLIFGLIISAAMVAFFIWFWFDGLYNSFRGQIWFSTGSEDGKDDAKTDNFLQSIPMWLGIGIKLSGMIGTIYFYIKNLK